MLAGLIGGKPGTGVVALILAMHFYAFALQRPVFIVGTTLVMLAWLALRGLHVRFGLSSTLLASLLWLVLFAPAFLKPWHGFSPVYYAFASLVSLGVANVVTHDPEIMRRAFVRLYWTTVALLSVVLYLNAGSREPFAEVISGSSTNGIPAYLIVMQIGLTVSSYASRQRLPLFSPLITFYIAFEGNGRGSLVVAALIIAGTVGLGLLGSKHSSFRRKVLISAGVAALAGLAAIYGNQAFDYVLAHTKLSVGLADANRGAILWQYVGKLDAYSALAGASYEGTLVKEIYNDNPHIAFIRAHSFFGLGYTLLALASPLLIFLGRGSLWSKVVVTYFIGLAVLRAASEPVLFPTLLDMVYFSCFFLYFRRRRAVQPPLLPARGIDARPT
jgi:hypothetical protein